MDDIQTKVKNGELCTFVPCSMLSSGDNGTQHGYRRTLQNIKMAVVQLIPGRFFPCSCCPYLWMNICGTKVDNTAVREGKKNMKNISEAKSTQKS